MDGVPHEATTPEELPTPRQDSPPAGTSRQQGSADRPRSASNDQGGFQWDAMGSVAADSEPVDPIWGQLMSGDESPKKSPEAKPATIVNRSVNSTAGST